LEAQFLEATESYSRDAQKMRVAFDAQMKAINADHSDARKTFAKSLRTVRRRFARRGVILQQKTNAAIDEINQTRITFEEFMRLKAPVQYWHDKAKNHQESRAYLAKVLVVFSVVATVALGLGLYQLAEHALKIAAAQTSTHSYLLFAALGVVGTTIVFWIARILTRLFLSQHHLAIDSEERAIMVQTYLALTANNLATADERAIVLGSLFRPTADGIVKDDAAPDLGPSAILSRLVQR
jgi:uncharacterized membrane protein YidH (DUF202 family)